MRFYTKMDGWAYLLFLLFFYQTVKMVWLAFVSTSVWTIAFSLIFLLFFGFILLPIYFATYYEVGETALNIRFGLLLKMDIPYEDIYRLCPIKGITFCFGLSIKRLALFYTLRGKPGSMVISPRNPEELIKQVQKKNPKIDTNTAQSGPSIKEKTGKKKRAQSPLN